MDTASRGSLFVEPLHERAAKQLRDMIVEGRLAPGEPISEPDLCREFGISRTPLREALKIVAAEGLIELLPRRGAIVKPIVFADVRDKFDLVRLLEDHAVQLACERATDGQLEALQRVHTTLLERIAKGDIPGFLVADDEFHRGLLRCSGSPTLNEVHANLWAHLRRARYRVLSGIQISPDYLQSRERLMKAIRRRDAKAAIREMEARWEAAGRLLASLEPGEDAQDAIAQNVAAGGGKRVAPRDRSRAASRTGGAAATAPRPRAGARSARRTR